MLALLIGGCSTSEEKRTLGQGSTIELLVDCEEGCSVRFSGGRTEDSTGEGSATGSDEGVIQILKEGELLKTMP